jgi:hypothetical protein
MLHHHRAGHQSYSGSAYKQGATLAVTANAHANGDRAYQNRQNQPDPVDCGRKQHLSTQPEQADQQQARNAVDHAQAR